VRFTGLSRVYRVSVYAVDHTRSDINGLLPLIAEPPTEKRALLIRTLSEPHFLRPNGVSMVSAQDPNFDPSSANGGGGVWPFFVTLLGEGLIEHGAYELAADLLKRLLRTQAAVLQEQDHLSEFYHTDQPRGLGEADYIGGIVPLNLLMMLIGVVIRPDGSVTIDPVFAWGAPITLTQHGVTVARTSAKTTVTFPNGQTTEVPADGNRHTIKAPDGTASRPEITLPAPPELSGEGRHNRVIIAVQDESDQP
jgi:hypothetical protein